MNRRGFFGLLGKLVSVGVAMGVSPSILEPVMEKVSPPEKEIDSPTPVTSQYCDPDCDICKMSEPKFSLAS